MAVSDWPSTFGNPGNTNFIEDVAIRPPFRLKWGIKCGGQFKQSVCATDQDLIYVTLSGLVECREQATGRIRWRRHLPGQAWCRSSVTIADGMVFVPRMFSLRYPKSLGAESFLYCLDVEDGTIKWHTKLGIGDRLRASPVYCQGVVALGSLYREEGMFDDTPNAPQGQIIDAWDAGSGKKLWQVVMPSKGMFLNGPAGCASEDRMFFTGGGEGNRDTGATISIEPRTGEILWHSDYFASQTGTPSYQSERLYLPGTYRRPLVCLNAADESVAWVNDEHTERWHVDVVALGTDFFSVNNKYRGGAWKWDLSSGRPIEQGDTPFQIWGPAHGCGAIVLTASGYALSATIGGLCATDVETGELAWNSPGFASYACPHPIAANGHLFYAPQTSGMIFCFEPINEDE